MEIAIAIVVGMFLLGSFFVAWMIVRMRAFRSESPENQDLMIEYAEAKAKYYDVVLLGMPLSEASVPFMANIALRDRAAELYGPKMAIKERCLKAGIPEWKLKLL